MRALISPKRQTGSANANSDLTRRCLHPCLTILPVFPVAPFFFHGARQSSLIDAKPSPLLNSFKKTPPTLHSSRYKSAFSYRLMKTSNRE
jgi:hypothetical protein